MGEDTRDRTTGEITWLFIILIILHPLIYFILLFTASGTASASLLKPLVLFYPVIAFFSIIFFISKNRYLDKIIDYIRSGREINQDELGDPVKKYPAESMVILFSGCVAAPFIAVFAGSRGGFILSPVHGLFIFMLGAVPAFSSGMIFYYRIREIISPYMKVTGVELPSLRGKITLPLLAVSLTVSVLTSAAVYRISNANDMDKTAEFMAVSKEGKILFDSINSGLTGRTIGAEIKDDGEGTSGTGQIVTLPAGRYFTYTLAGVEKRGIKTDIPSEGYSLVYSVNTSEHEGRAVRIILTLLGGIIITAVSAVAVSFYISVRLRSRGAGAGVPVHSDPGDAENLTDEDYEKYLFSLRSIIYGGGRGD